MRGAGTVLSFAFTAFAAAAGLPPPANRAVTFDADIAPILAAHCTGCHGPEKRKGGLRLDLRDGALTGGEGGPAIIPGDSAQSPLVRNAARVEGALPMPPKGDPLTPEQIGLLRAWIDQGAPWGAKSPAPAEPAPRPLSWAFAPLASPPVPEVAATDWPRTPVDRFILARLEREGLAPSPPADRRTLIRRATFDLTGLPPAPAEIDAFLADTRPDAWEAVIDRLLASPRFGERMGRRWLDLAHYGETHGFDKDKRRPNAWPYRDYVIRAMNDDKPYAEFIREQIAGDRLRPRDPDGIVATGFLAAGPWDFVGHVELREGTSEKERVRSLDRDDMLASVISTFTSMTAHCARCHDHKFDPIPQRDYYRLQAVFAGVDRADRPYESKPMAEFRASLDARRQSLEDERSRLRTGTASNSSAELAALSRQVGTLRERLAAMTLAPGSEASPTNGYHSAISDSPDAVKWVRVDLGRVTPLDTIRLIPARPTDFIPDTPGFGFPLRFRVELADDEPFTNPVVIDDRTAEDQPNPGASPCEINAAGRSARFIRVTATRLWERTHDHVFALGELQAWSGGRNVAAGARVDAGDSIEAGRWGKAHLVDGFDSRARLADRGLAAGLAAGLRPALAARLKDAEERRDQLEAMLRDPAAGARLDAIERELDEITRWTSNLPKPGMVYALDSHAPREIRILNRGGVDAPGDPVGPGALSAVPGLESDFKLPDPADEAARRLALADWIAAPGNMLTWRSIVNRVWGWHFGRALADTPNDFGNNGSKPTHPELLDWLAADFRDHGGSLKRLHRLILLSAAYMQSSAPDPARASIDADNRLLWRMNRRKLEAEEVRDAALAVAGRLNLRMGGPSFDLFNFKDDHSPRYDYAHFDSPDARRRAVYRSIVRSVPDPFMASLDCPDPSINTPVRNETLTALQALSLLNNPFMLRQSEAWAARLEGLHDTAADRITGAFVQAFARPPAKDEAGALSEYVRAHGLPAACRILLNANEFIFID